MGHSTYNELKDSVTEIDEAAVISIKEEVAKISSLLEIVTKLVGNNEAMKADLISWMTPSQQAKYKKFTDLWTASNSALFARHVGLVDTTINKSSVLGLNLAALGSRLDDLVTASDATAKNVDETLRMVGEIANGSKEGNGVRPNQSAPATIPVPYSAIAARRPRKPKAYYVKTMKENIGADQLEAEVVSIITTIKNIETTDVASVKNGIRIKSTRANFVEKISDPLKCSELQLTIEEEKPILPQILAVVKTKNVEDEDELKRRTGFTEDETCKIVWKNDFACYRGVKLTRLVIRLSEGARNKLEQNGRLLSGCEGVSFEDNFSVRTCTHCHSIGNTMKYCRKINDHFCSKCAEGGHIGENFQKDLRAAGH